MKDDDLKQRVAYRALQLALNPKANLIGSLTGHVRLGLKNKEMPSEDEIDAELRKLVKTHRSHFGPDASLTAEQKLDLANANAAKREQNARAEAPPLSEKEIKKLEKMTPEQRLDFANVRRAEAMKKMVTP